MDYLRIIWTFFYLFLVGIMNIQDKIRQIRKVHQLSQEKMADELNISCSSYAKIERGETRLQFNTLQQIAQIFHMSISQLVDLKEKSTVIVLGSDNDTNNANINYYASSESMAHEIEKLKILIVHKDKIIQQKDELINVLKEQIELLKIKT